MNRKESFKQRTVFNAKYTRCLRLIHDLHLETIIIDLVNAKSQSQQTFSHTRTPNEERER